MAGERNLRILFFAIVAVPCAVLATWLLAVSVWGFWLQRGLAHNASWNAVPSGDVWTVSWVAPDGPAAGKVQAGDRIVSINGSDRAAYFGPRAALAGISAPYQIEVERDGKRLQTTISVWETRRDTRAYFCYLLLALLYLAVAIWIGTARPTHLIAQLACLLFVFGVVAYAYPVFWHYASPMSPTWIALGLAMGASWWHPLEWALFYDFSLRFPIATTPARFPRLLRVALYAVAAVIALLGLLPAAANVLGLQTRSAFISLSVLVLFDRFMANAVGIVSSVALVSTLIVFTTKYRTLADASARVRLRWIAFGVAAALIPVVFRMGLIVIFRVLGYPGAAEHAGQILDAPSWMAPALIPVTFTYAIVKHRVMGLRFALRRGVQYLLAKNVLQFIWYLPLIGIALDVLAHPHEPLEKFLFHESWWVYLLALATISVGLRYRRRIEPWVDKKFFRSAYEEELILSELVEQMQASDTVDEIARLVATKLEEAFKPNGAAVLYRRNEGSKFTVSYAHEAPFALQFCGDQDTRLDSVLSAQSFPTIYPEVPAAVAGGLASRNSDSTETLVMPIRTAAGKVTAVLLLGAKKSEESYTNRDRKLLQAVATQAGLILEVIGLKEQIREEGRVRVEVLAKLDKQSVQLIVECPECGRCYAGSDIMNCKSDGARLTLTLPIERVIDGKYRLERRIGAGGMGAVYEATDLRLGRLVAVKVMTGRLFGNNQALRRFEREARAAARLQHPNIVPVYDFGPLRGDGAYLVMQRISGRSWRAELDRFGAIKLERAVGWFEQLCDAMIAAHASGIIHRDLKPENLLISAWESNANADKVTVLDFGLAKMNALDVAGESLTAEESVIGSLAYMSPEQRAGERVDGRSDIFSSGVVVVETLSGNRPPQHGATQQWLQDSLVWTNGTPACRELTQFLDRCLAPFPSDRVSSMSRFKRELIPRLRQCPAPEIAKPVAARGSVSTLPL